MLYKQFYSELGKLLYAVADIDGVITAKEKKALQDIINKELAPYEKHKDAFGTNVAAYTGIEFDFMDEGIREPADAFNSFIDFVEEHHTGIDQQLKKLCLHIVDEIAAAYHGTNKKEKQLIEQLKSRLNKIEFKKTKTGKKKHTLRP